MRYSTSSSLSAAVLALASSAQAGVNYFRGVAVNNYLGNDATAVCKAQSDWDAIASDLADNGFDQIRIYSTDCEDYGDALTYASNAAVSYGLKVLVGLYQSGDTIADSETGLNNDVQVFLSAYDTYGADLYTGLTITNEIDDTAENIMTYTWNIRGYLQSLGIYTPVSAVHTSYFYSENSVMCEGDQVTANAQAFYDGSTSSSEAGTYLSGQIEMLEGLCSVASDLIWITEAGWPTRGDADGPATPSIDDMTTANQQQNCAVSGGPAVNVFLFEAEDSLWKDDEWEQSFGVFNKDGFSISSLWDIC